MNYLRALIFTILVPCTVSIYIPLFILKQEVNFHFASSHPIGIALIAAGGIGYISTVFSFLIRGGGTPAIWFTRGLKFLIGEEPSKSVTNGLYRFSRNPMYLSVLTVIAGMGVLKQNYFILIYGTVVFLLFHFVVVFIEEPHLKKKFGATYTEYFSKTRRWV